MKCHPFEHSNKNQDLWQDIAQKTLIKKTIAMSVNEQAYDPFLTWKELK